MLSLSGAYGILAFSKVYYVSISKVYTVYFIRHTFARLYKAVTLKKKVTERHRQREV